MRCDAESKTLRPDPSQHDVYSNGIHPHPPHKPSGVPKELGAFTDSIEIILGRFESLGRSIGNTGMLSD